MKQKIILFSVLTLFLEFGTAQLANTLLWSIEGNGLNKSYIYLTGMSCAKEVLLSDKMKKILPEVKSIVVEYDLYTKDAQKLASFNIANNEEEKVKNLLSNGDYNTFLNLLKDAGYPDNVLPTFAIYKPAVIYMVLKSIISPCNKMAPTIYEQAFKKISNQYKVDFKVLKTVDDVINDLKSYSQEYWKENIRYILLNQEFAKSAILKELEAYKSENLSELKSIFNGTPYYKTFYSGKLRKTWVESIESSLARQAQLEPSLFTLDISNVLLDGASLFQQLKSKGYIVSPIL